MGLFLRKFSRSHHPLARLTQPCSSDKARPCPQEKKEEPGVSLPEEPDHQFLQNRGSVPSLPSEKLPGPPSSLARTQNSKEMEGSTNKCGEDLPRASDPEPRGRNPGEIPRAWDKTVVALGSKYLVSQALRGSYPRILWWSEHNHLHPPLSCAQGSAQAPCRPKLCGCRYLLVWPFPGHGCA